MNGPVRATAHHCHLDVVYTGSLTKASAGQGCTLSAGKRALIHLFDCGYLSRSAFSSRAERSKVDEVNLELRGHVLAEHHCLHIFRPGIQHNQRACPDVTGLVDTFRC